MDDLISRAAAIEYLMTNMGWHDEDGYEVDDADEKRAIITDLVNGIPAMDAVPVVRCKDCKHWVCADTVGSIRYGDCTNKLAIISRHAMPNENYYCADGEWRERQCQSASKMRNSI